MTTVKLRFNKWKEPNESEPTVKTITFYNDGQFTTNDTTDVKIPMNIDDFNKIIKVYKEMPDVDEITDQND